MINQEDTHLNKEIFKKYFPPESPSLMPKVLQETNNDKEKNSKLVNIFSSGLEDLEK